MSVEIPKPEEHFANPFLGSRLDRRLFIAEFKERTNGADSRTWVRIRLRNSQADLPGLDSLKPRERAQRGNPSIAPRAVRNGLSK